jgi:hypothetical protein
MKGYLLIPFILLPVLGIGRTAAQEADVTKIEQECLAYRRAIKSGHVVLDVVRHYVHPGSGDVEEKSQLEIFFEPGKLRFDRRTVVADLGAKPYHTRCIVTPADVISRNVELPEGHLNVGVTIRNPPIENSELHVFDPRQFGLASGNANVLCHYELDTCIGQPKRTETKVSNERLGDRDVKVVEYTRPSGLQVRIYFRNGDPRYVARIESRSLYQDKVLLDRIDCRYAKVRDGEVVFPSQIDYVRQFDGKPAFESKETVKSATFNKDIDASQFTLATMALRPGTQIHRPKGLTKEWDGTKEVPLGTIRPLP